jgi:hypothetical protein
MDGAGRNRAAAGLAGILPRMAGTEAAGSEFPGSAAVSTAAETRDSARGWHQIQLAVLGFVGLCGVLQRGRPDNPMWLQSLAALLIFGALATALIAIAVVGRVAWPLARPPAQPAKQLKTGILLTFLAVAMLALGTTSMWWPESRSQGEQVQVQAADGQTWCGRLTEEREGTVGVRTDEGPVVIRLADVAAVRPAGTCD